MKPELSGKIVVYNKKLAKQNNYFAIAPKRVLF